MVETGLSENISIKDSGSTEKADLLGIISAANHSKSEDVNQVASVGQGAQYQQNIDGLVEVTGSVTGMPPNLKCLQFLGSFTDDGDGTYTVEPTTTLPEYTFKQQKIEGGGTATLSNFKFGSFSLSGSEGENLEVEFSGMGKDFSFDDSETISTPSVSGTVRRFFDLKVKIGDSPSVIGSVESFTIDFNRNLEAFKGIEDFTSGSKRKPTELIEKLFDGSFNLVINITDSTAYQRAMDDTSSPYEVNDSRTDTKVQLVIDTSAGTDTLELTGARPDEVSADMANDAEKRTVTLSGVYQDWSVDGDL